MQTFSQEELKLKEFLRSIHPVSEEILVEYLSQWHPREYPKRSHLILEGDVQRHLYFITAGVCKSSIVYQDREVVTAFTYAPSLCAIPDSFLRQTPSRFVLQSITELKFLQIHYQDHKRMVERHRSLETLFRLILEEILFGVIDRSYELQAADMESRFRIFYSRSAHLFNLVSQKDIASYLRIDPTNLSKLLAKMRS